VLPRPIGPTRILEFSYLYDASAVFLIGPPDFEAVCQGLAPGIRSVDLANTGHDESFRAFRVSNGIEEALVPAVLYFYLAFSPAEGREETI
jgi:hypothetical protein